MSVAAPDLVLPAWHTCPAYERTDGPLVAEISTLAGLEPDAEQRLILDDLFALTGDDRAVAFETAIICARQNLKTAVAQMAVLGWLFGTQQRLVVWSAHQFPTAQEAFRDLDDLCSSDPWFTKQVARVWRANGDEAIELKSGARVIFRARTKGGGRGLSGDKVVLDEAFALHQMHMGALLPTLSARPDPQVVYASSAGLADSDVLRGVRDRGRVGDSSLAYLEWGDPNPREGCELRGCDHSLDVPGCALDDRERWLRANPAMGRRIDEGYVAQERRAMPPVEFARERLGWWDEPELHGRVIPGPAWDALAEPGSTVVGEFVAGVDVSPNRESASLSVCGVNAEGVPHVEVVKSRSGTGWMIADVERLGARAVVIDTAGAAASLIPGLEAAGLTVIKASAAEMTQACGAFYDAVMSQQVRHIDQGPLNAALAGARKRELAAAWAWNRKDATVDLTPLVSVTLALWGWQSADSRPIEPSMYVF